jgi:hypothetical protein
VREDRAKTSDGANWRQQRLAKTQAQAAGNTATCRVFKGALLLAMVMAVTASGFAINCFKRPARGTSAASRLCANCP